MVNGRSVRVAHSCASIEFFDLEFGEMTRLGLVIHGGAVYNCPGS